MGMTGSYFNSIGLETEFIDVRNIRKYEGYTDDDDIVADIVKAYTKIGLPIITTLRLVDHQKNHDFHAAVISGYRHKHGILEELYVHDDRIGPYSKVIPVGKFNKWDNEWVRSGEFSNLFVDQLVIPIYPKRKFSLNPFHVFSGLLDIRIMEHRSWIIFMMEPLFLQKNFVS